MADELLTVLLQLKGDTRDIKAALAGVDNATAKVGKAAKAAAKEQDDWFKATRKGLMNVRAGFGEYTGTLGVAKQAFGFLGSAADAFAKKNEAAGKAWKDASNNWDKSLAELKEGIGSVVVQFAPLIDQLASVASLLADIADNALVKKAIELAGDAIRYGNPLASRGTQTGSDDRTGVLRGQASAIVTTGATPDDPWAMAGALGDAVNDELKARGINVGGLDPALVQRVTDAVAGYAEKNPYRKRKGGGGAIEVDDYTGPRIGDSMFGRMGHDFWGDEAARQAPWAVDAYGRSSAGDTTGLGGMGTGGAFPGADQLASANAAMDALVAKTQGETIMERMFGTVDHIDGYAVAFDGISNAVTSAYDAWVDGSMSVGAAIKASLALSIKSMGAEMAISALKETALGFGSLAWGPLGKASAAAHFKSAGLFAIGAAAAGVAAKGLSGGGAGVSNPSMGGGYGSNLGGGGSSQGGGNRSVTVVLGDGAAGDSSRWRARRVGKAIGAARREMGGDWVTAS